MLQQSIWSYVEENSEIVLQLPPAIHERPCGIKHEEAFLEA